MTSEIDGQSREEYDRYWTERYKAAIAEGDYCKRMLGAQALRELDGVDE